jgi:hypothetical protein
MRIFKDGAIAVVWSEPYWSEGSFDLSLALLEGEVVDWNSITGFKTPERTHSFGNITVVYDSYFSYAHVLLGTETGDIYLIATDSLQKFVASYGGANTWHTRGTYRVSAEAWEKALKQVKGE